MISNPVLSKCIKATLLKPQIYNCITFQWLSFANLSESRKAKVKIKLGILRNPQGIYYSSSSKRLGEQLLVNSYGDPLQVVYKETFSLPSELEKNQVAVKVLASAVNPADINTIQGVYAIKPEFPFVPGNEAVMEITATGSDVTDFEVGDRVIPKLNAMGTWRTELVASKEEFIKIPKDIDIITGSTIAVNPCTAYRMLTDFVPLKPDDVVIQNCSNSAVGQAVIQVAKDKGFKTVNIVRDRPNFEELDSYLKSLGATVVIKETDLRASNELLKSIPKPRLALNGVSGKSGTDILRQLAPGGTMVTYGGMSRMPLAVPVASLIFSDVILRGYWMTRWNTLHRDHPERTAMFNYLFDLSRNGKLKPPPHDFVPFADYKSALEQAMPTQGMVGRKQVIVF